MFGPGEQFSLAKLDCPLVCSRKFVLLLLQTIYLGYGIGVHY